MKHCIPQSTDFAFHGILSALVTPFDAQGAVDVVRLASFVDYLIERGVHGLIPLGSTRAAREWTCVPVFIERLTALLRVEYVKESTGEMSRITELIRRCGQRLGVFCGCDTLALESFVAGAIGWVGGVVDVLPAAHVQWYVMAIERGDFRDARERYYDLLPLLELMEGGGKYTQSVKAACRLMGHDVGPPRAPLCVPNEQEMELLRTVLEPWQQRRIRSVRMFRGSRNSI